MKTLKYIALAALTISFAACTQDEDFIPQGDADAVKITASIGALQTRVSYDAKGNTTFGEGDQIRVINLTRSGMNKSDAVYRRGSTDNWEPAEATKYVVWHGTETNTFYGVYPYDAEYDNFTISTDQSSDITAADWMTATYTGVKGTSNNVSFNFRHRLAKVTVNITEWNDEFDGEAQTVSNPRIYTKGTAIEVSYGSGTDGANEYISNGGLTPIWPYATGRTYTAIVAPVKYAANDNFMTFTVNDQGMTVLAKTDILTGGLESGKHYTFNLSVGKHYATISSVQVTPWSETEIDGGVAKECEHNFVDGICTECGTEASYIYDESSNTYRLYKAEYLKATIEEASNTGISTSPATIILMDDITVPQGTSEDWMFEDNVEFNKGIVELDLNGKTLTTAIGLLVNATLVIHDGSNATGQIISSSRDMLVGVAESGTLTINGGILNSTAISNGAVVGYGGRITINGGTFVAEGSAVSPQSSPLTITGGQFESAECALDLHSSSQNILIIGGSFVGGIYDINTSGQTGFLSFNYETGEGPRFPGGISIYNHSSLTNYTLNPLLATEAEYVDANGNPISISDDADSYEGDVIVKRKQ